MAVLRGTIYWADIRKPNKKTKKLQYDLGNLDKDTVKVLKEAGVRIKDKGDDKGQFITVQGSVKYPPRVYDSQNNLLPEPVRIGNGSTVKTNMRTYETEYEGEKFHKVSMSELMVIDMVSFGGLEAEEGGYVADTNTSPFEAEDATPIGDDEAPI